MTDSDPTPARATPLAPPSAPLEAAPPAPLAQDAPPLLLVDGSSYLYRAYHAMPDLRAVPGDATSPATGAIRGIINMLERLRKDWPTNHAAMVFDAPGPTFRDALYPDYKAHRSPMPDDLRAQIPAIHEVVRLLGWPVLVVPGVEADDVIGTLAATAAAQGRRVVVSSGDKDLAQLVDARVTIIDTLSGKVRDVAGVQAEFGVAPAQMVDYQTLVGDAVDNVPGVDKVGPKTAAKWLAEYGSLDALVARAGEVKGAAGENLRQALGWLPTGRQLLTIRTDCDLQPHLPATADGRPDLAAVAMQPPQTATLKAFYEQYGFKGLARALGGAGAPGAGAGAGADAPASANRSALAGTPTAPSLLDEAAPAPPAITQTQYETILTWEALERWLARLHSAQLSALDTETTSLDEMQARIVGLSFAVTPGEAAYLPLAHEGPDAPAQLPLQEALARLRPWLENPACPKLGQHIKYDQHVLANHGIAVQGYVHDTLLQSYVLEVHKPHNLQSLAERHLGRSGISYEALCGKGAHQIAFAQVPVDKAAQYSCEDSDLTLDVHRVLWPRLQAAPTQPPTQPPAQSLTQPLTQPPAAAASAAANPAAAPSPAAPAPGENHATQPLAQDLQKTGLRHEKPGDIATNSIATQPPANPYGLAFIYQLEIDSSHTLYRMERHGVLIDAQVLAAQSNDLGKRIYALEKEAHELAGQPFNLGSPKQIGDIFFSKLGFPIVKKTATGAPSTDEEVLEKLAEDYPLPARILEHRSLSKLKGTYTDKLPQMVNPRTGRVHTHYAQAVAVTGRLSSNDPNLQNIPIRTPEGRRVREAFIAPPGHLIASADYSQIELRIMAHLSGDAALTRAFAEGMDVHRATAAEVFGLPPEAVSAEQRRYAKVINFGLIYGMSAFGLARALGIDNTAAKNYIAKYFERFAGVKRYMDDTRQAAKSQGYVQTVFGRRLYLPEINSPNGPRRSGAERAAINAPMQGTAADLIKLSMNAVQQALDAQGRATQMVMQVHDELVFEVPEAEVDWLKTEVPRLMASVAQLAVPLVAEVGVGANWEAAH